MFRRLWTGMEMQVVKLQTYKNRDVVAALKGLLEMAERGDVAGLAFVIKTGPHAHQAGAAGDYERYPDEALSATFAMKLRLVQGRLHNE